MIAIEDLQPNCTFADNCGHLFVLRTFSVHVAIGSDGTRRPIGIAILEKIALNSSEKPLTVTIPIDGVRLLHKIADHDLSAFSTPATERRFIDSDAA
jgi:hypothetical protein